MIDILNKFSWSWIVGFFWFLHACFETWIGSKAAKGQLPFGSTAGAMKFFMSRAILPKNETTKGENMEALSLAFPIGPDTKFDLSLEGQNPVISFDYATAEVGIKASVELKSIAALEHVKALAPENKLLAQIVDLAEVALKKLSPDVKAP